MQDVTVQPAWPVRCPLHLINAQPTAGHTERCSSSLLGAADCAEGPPASAPLQPTPGSGMASLLDVAPPARGGDVFELILGRLRLQDLQARPAPL